MDIREDIRSITYMKQQAARLIADVSKRRRPVVITQSGEAKAVVVDVQSYERNRRALLLLKLIQMSEGEIRKGKTQSQDELFRDVESLLSAGKQ